MFIYLFIYLFFGRGGVEGFQTESFTNLVIFITYPFYLHTAVRSCAAA